MTAGTRGALDFAERVRRKLAFDGQLCFGAGAFNRKTDRLRHEEYRRSHDTGWMDPATGMLDERVAYHRRACPACDSTGVTTLFVKAGFPHVRCDRCGLIYVTPCLRPEVLAEDVTQEESYSAVLANPLTLELDELKFAYGLDLLCQYVDASLGTAMCDIGCGPGGFLSLARERGFNVLAIEPGRRYHAYLRERGIPFAPAFYPGSAFADLRWDVVTLWAIFEHVLEPRAFLEAVRTNLRPEGHLFICVPNAEALVTRLLRERSNTFGGHSHLQFFSAATLGGLLARCGFEVVETDTMITELGTINNYLGFADPYAAQEPPHYEFLTPEFIYRHRLGSLLTVIARARS